jgi:FKBP-type peptidyl-prolyl cis-trans isomerase
MRATTTAGPGTCDEPLAWRAVRRLPCVLVVVCLVAAGCGSSDEAGTKTGTTASEPTATPVPKRAKPKVGVPKGAPPKKLVVRDLEPGTGRAARPGDRLSVQYVGVLYANGKQFDASWDHGGKPLTFILQAAQVIPGWDQGLEGMKVGGRRELVIPAKLAYGARGQPGIPPNSPLVFVLDLLKVS